MPTPPHRVADDRRPWYARFVAAALASALAVAVAAPARADEAPAKPAAKADKALDNEPAQWMRFSETGKGEGKLEVAIGTYRNDAGVTVHLVGAVHVGDKRYYADLDKLFESYDALLYEMVKPRGTGAPARGARKPGGDGMVTLFQRFLKDALELDFQLDGVDYSKKNFVHADLDAEAFEQMQAERGESILGLMLQQMIRELAKGADGKADAKPQPGLLDFLAILDAPDRAKQLKLILGRQFGDMEAQIAGFQGTVLVTERNKRALAVLKDTIRAGKKNIGVFYGAAHMPDMESRLALMGFKRVGLEYKVAWDISDRPAAKADDTPAKAPDDAPPAKP
ncbi:MAG: TraB family protein [Phycisphaerales bacterium]|nr:TraB family protein [Phycisphaerales bacterium]